ncbi:DNA-binding protein [Bacillus manliponensis]|uniref:DNA-binding protein n=1 Tax=Bacillus manliponensis TaxID=574376 RepID=A0A073KED3_9BACI|nr:helix-turn-helix transcriptional regulator [Bacillus manliponensis]KEK20678.1 DNA-binding protein [Bacillus manliponensis]
MTTLGEKIRTLRKEKKLTQSTLAGEELTKSMLSQIENGKATPSMKTLQYIADKLGCEPSFLLEEEDSELASLVHEMKQLIQKREYKKVYETLHSTVQHELPATLHTARIYHLYIQASLFQKEYDVRIYVEKAVSIFKKYSLHQEGTETEMSLVLALFYKKQYKESLQLIHSIRDQYKQQFELDTILQIQLLLYEAVVFLATGDYEKCQTIILQSLAFSKEKQVYYRTDELYRILSHQAVFFNDKEGYLYYLKKAEQFAVFIEDTLSIAVLDILRAYFHNSMTKQYTKALQYVEAYQQYDIEGGEGYYYLEKGKALYGLQRYEEALEALHNVTMPTYAGHPVDKAWILTAGAYRALCYMALSNKEQALHEAQAAQEAIQEYHVPMFVSFVEETLQNIKNM